jgi:hypothetical protein
MTRKQYDEISELAIACFNTTFEKAVAAARLKSTDEAERDADAKQKFWRTLAGLIDYAKDDAA